MIIFEGQPKIEAEPLRRFSDLTIATIAAACRKSCTYMTSVCVLDNVTMAITSQPASGCCCAWLNLFKSNCGHKSQRSYLFFVLFFSDCESLRNKTKVQHLADIPTKQKKNHP